MSCQGSNFNFKLRIEAKRFYHGSTEGTELYGQRDQGLQPRHIRSRRMANINRISRSESSIVRYPSLRRSADAIDQFFVAILLLTALKKHSCCVFHNSDEFRTNE